MSSPLAIAAVTATLCDVLNHGLSDPDLAPLGSVSVTAIPPDRIETGNNEKNGLNLFLYQVTSNPGWRNQGEPSQGIGTAGSRLSNPPLAIDLHYMLTAYGTADFAAEVLLGRGMELLHDARVLSREEIRAVLKADANPVKIAHIKRDSQGRLAIDLADQIEQVKITPHYLSADELSKLWTAMQARYRPTMVYQVTTVLIQARRPTRAPLPVLTRGQEDSGVTSQPDLTTPSASRPTLASIRVIPATTGEQRISAEQGDALEITGSQLDGDVVTAEFSHRLLTAPIPVKVAAGSTATRALVGLPQSHDPTQAATFVAGADTKWPVGLYSVALRMERGGKPTQRTGPGFFNLVPRLSAAPTISGSGSTLTIAVTCFPQIWKDQAAEVFVGAEPFTPKPIADKSATLTATIAGVTPSEIPVPVTLRVDGADSELVRNRTSQPPQFEAMQRVSLPL